MTNCSLNSIACTPLYQHLSNLKSSPQQANSGTYIVHVAQNNDPIEAIDFHSNTNNLNHSHSTLITSFSFADIKKETNQKQESNSKCTSHQFPYKECRSHQHARVVNCKHLNQCIDYASDHGPVKKMALSQLILLACVMFLYEYMSLCNPKRVSSSGCKPVSRILSRGVQVQTATTGGGCSKFSEPSPPVKEAL